MTHSTPALSELAVECQIHSGKEVSIPEPRPWRVWRAVFSFPVVLALFLALVTLFTVRGRFSDPDMWWHLKTGEIIWNTLHIPTADSFSFTTHNHPYVPQEWLSQLAMYAAYHFGGYTGLMLWLCLLSSLFVIAIYALCAVYSGNAKVAFFGGLIAWLFSTIGLSIRPQMIGYLLLVCELLILHFGRSRDRRWFLALPPLFAVWVNCHGSFFLGLVILAIAVFCSFAELHMGLLVSERCPKQERNTLALASVLSIPALFLNPIGLKQVTYPLDVIFSQHIGTTFVSEWQPPQFDNGRALALLAVAGLILLVPIVRGIELRLRELLFLALGFGLAVCHERMLFVFGILAGPILCRLLATAWDAYDPNRDRPLVNAVAIALALFIMVWAFPSRHFLEQHVENGNPVKAVEFIKRSGLSGNMLNEYVFGGYLIWAAPQHKVFIDGRSDVFEWTGVLRDYGRFVTLAADPNTILDKYQIRFCLLARNEPMCRVLPLLPGWKMVYSDRMAAVFSRSVGAAR